MRRRQSLRLLGLLPAWLAACKSKFPNAPTVITGKVVDKDGLPMKGVELALTGDRKKGLILLPTFREEVVSDEKGMYSVSSVITKSTDLVQLSIGDGNTRRYFAYGDDQYRLVSSDLKISPQDYGGTIEINFKFQ